ncbi:MAG: acyltransferase [Kiritimatiellae bacterium]|nr:acyltransferase [Kiritimatiellia bacterium]
MKAWRAIGPGKAIRFALGGVCNMALKLCAVPMWRAALLRLLGARIGRDCVIHDCRFINFYRGSFRNLCMGRECYIGQECLLDLAARIEFGNQVTLGPRVTVLTHLNVGYEDHPLQRAFPATAEPVRLRDGVFVSASCTILGGAEIGEAAFVAAGSVVAKGMPARHLLGGIPARPIRPIAADDRAAQEPGAET